MKITTGPTFCSHRETVVVSLSYKHKMAFTTYIFKEDLERLKRDADPLRATGGSLYGQWTSTGDPVVHVAISKSGKYMDGVETFFFKNYRLCHIGEWRVANPDHRTREELLSKYKGSRPAKIFVILEVTAEATYPFLFVDGKSHGEGRVEALQGENLYNKLELLGTPTLTRIRREPRGHNIDCPRLDGRCEGIRFMSDQTSHLCHTFSSTRYTLDNHRFKSLTRL